MKKLLLTSFALLAISTSFLYGGTLDSDLKEVKAWIDAQAPLDKAPACLSNPTLRQALATLTPDQIASLNLNLNFSVSFSGPTAQLMVQQEAQSLGSSSLAKNLGNTLSIKDLENKTVNDPLKGLNTIKNNNSLKFFEKSILLLLKALDIKKLEKEKAAITKENIRGLAKQYLDLEKVVIVVTRPLNKASNPQN